MIGNVGQAASSPTSAALQGPGGKMGKDEFLKILVAQMRHQDPMNPQQGHEFAAQLAQFSTLEQLISMNAQFTAQGEYQSAMVQAMNSNAAMGAIGRTVLAAGSDVTIPASGEAAVTVAVQQPGGMATLRLYDDAGREVGSRKVGILPGGRHEVDVGSAAEGLPPGQYTYKLEVAGSDGKPVQVSTYTTAVIDGVRYTAQGPMLTSGAINIPFGAIVEILAGR